MKKIISVIAITILAVLLLAIPGSATDSEAAISSVSLYSYPDKTVYGAFEKFDPEGMRLRVGYNDGSERIIDGRYAVVKYSSGSSFRVGDGSVEIIYGGKSLFIPVTVNRIPYDLSALELADFTVVYNGGFQTYTRPVGQIVGLDGIPLRINATGGGTNVGSYDISIDFLSDSKDYIVPESRVITMGIIPATAEICWGECSFTYDGRSKCPTAYYVDVNGACVYLSVSGAATNAGTGYVAKVNLADQNYNLINSRVSYEIRRADYDMSGVSWSADSFTYDGNIKSISVHGLPAGVSVISYTGDRGSDAGRYTATAVLSWDEQNYNAPPVVSHSWEIKKADYDISSISFRADGFIYDGGMHYPTLLGSMPIGADGIQLSYCFSDGACHVDDGIVSVIISFTTDSPNYNVPGPMYSSVLVIPREIEIEWGATELSYSGEVRAPEAYSSDCRLTVSGNGITVGKYVATASTDNTDFTIINPTVEYTIIKAENSWTRLPSASVSYEGKELRINGESLFGNIAYSFFSDSEGKNRIEPPAEVGVYYAILTVEGNENYGGLVSEPVRLEIIEVVAVSFMANIVKEGLRAFDLLTSSDMVCTVVYNDGEVEVIDSSLVEIYYEHGDSFRKKDRVVTLKYGDFVLSLPVDIGYADYDLSGVYWRETEAVYDGNAKYPIPDGLPEGVRLIGYTQNNMIDAGVYTVGVRLFYDSENYNEPIIPTCRFVINKSVVEIPTVYLTYNGSAQAPVCNSTVYTIEEIYVTDAGKYSVTARLIDSDNYIFVGGGDSVSALLEMLPAVLTVRVEDTELRLFEEPGEVKYTLVSGRVYGNDYVGLSVYTEGGMIYLRSENPNYILEVEAGKIIRLPYPTPEGGVIMLLVAILLTALIIIAVYVYRNRQRLTTAAAVIRCRWHNRDFCAPPTGKVIAPSAENDLPEREDIDEADDEGEDGNDVIEMDVDVDKADSLISDSLARSLIKREGEIIYTDGTGRAMIDVESLSREFAAGQRVDINSLKAKGLVPEDSAYLRVVGLGSINKPLSVYANDFNLSAVKMIALSGGKAVKIMTVKQKGSEENE